MWNCLFMLHTHTHTHTLPRSICVSDGCKRSCGGILKGVCNKEHDFKLRIPYSHSSNLLCPTPREESHTLSHEELKLLPHPLPSTALLYIYSLLYLSLPGIKHFSHAEHFMELFKILHSLCNCCLQVSSSTPNASVIFLKQWKFPERLIMLVVKIIKKNFTLLNIYYLVELLLWYSFMAINTLA